MITCPITKDLVEATFKKYLFALYGVVTPALQNEASLRSQRKATLKKRAAREVQPLEERTTHDNVVNRLLAAFPGARREVVFERGGVRRKADLLIGVSVVEVKTSLDTLAEYRKALSQAEGYASHFKLDKALVYCENPLFKDKPAFLVTSIEELRARV